MQSVTYGVDLFQGDLANVLLDAVILPQVCVTKITSNKVNKCFTGGIQAFIVGGVKRKLRLHCFFWQLAGLPTNLKMPTNPYLTSSTVY